MSNLSRRVGRLESETGMKGRLMHGVDLSELPQGYDPEQTLKELGVKPGPQDTVLSIVNPTDCEPPAGGKPKHLYSVAI